MEGLIRKIIIGKEPKTNAMAYYIGMPVGESKENRVSAIVYDDSTMARHSKSRYYIYLQEPDGAQVLWKTIDDMSCIVEYDLNF
jgi:hypothetical protein